MRLEITGRSMDYAEIRTLRQLRAERRKLGRVLGLQEQLLQEDYRTVKGFFSVSYVTGVVFKKLESWQNILRIAFDAYLFAMAFFRKRKEAREQPEEEQPGGE